MNALTGDIHAGSLESVFEQYSWFYALCRELLFTDHTDEIAATMTPLLEQSCRPVLLEVGCGPGFYASRLAQRFPGIDVIGLDPSEGLLARARQKAERAGLENCRFVRARVQQLSDFPEAADFIIASRLFLILMNRGFALETIYTALKPNGLLFIAEPRSALRAALPLACMRILQVLSGSRSSRQTYQHCRVLDKAQFADFVGSQPWKRVRHWSDQRYQYALCEKPA
jgi:arsenite methyltransferase